MKNKLTANCLRSQFDNSEEKFYFIFRYRRILNKKKLTFFTSAFLI